VISEKSFAAVKKHYLDYKKNWIDWGLNDWFRQPSAIFIA
jgi:hypothetical protein